jgi:two-component system, LytTR family, sensor kinase
MTKRRVSLLALAAILWTLPALVFTTQNYASHLQTEHPLGWLRILRWELPNWYAWAALSPLILMVARRFRLETGRGRAVLAHLAALLLFIVAHTVLHIGAVWLLGWNAQPWPSLGGAMLSWLSGTFGAAMLVYLVIVALFYAIDYHEAFQLRTRNGLELEAKLARAQLQALKMQLRPHFLFNALNSISGLMAADVAAARTMLVRLSELLRLSLEADGAQEVPLRQELEFLRLYLDIQQLRFRDRLTVEFSVSADTLEAWVPKFLLQPLVENALVHGIGTQLDHGHVEIRAYRNNGHLRLQVSDDGPGFTTAGSAARPIRERVGVGNARARLQLLYGAAHRFELSNAPTGGCRVLIEIPHREEPVLAGRS